MLTVKDFEFWVEPTHNHHQKPQTVFLVIHEVKDVLSKTRVYELHVWHTSAARLILCSLLGCPITLTVFVPLPTQAFSWSFSSPGSKARQQTGLFTLGSSPARLTPFTQDNPSRQVLCPCLPSHVPVPCWGTHNSHHCHHAIRPHAADLWPNPLNI